MVNRWFLFSHVQWRWFKCRCNWFYKNRSKICRKENI